MKTAIEELYKWLEELYNFEIPNWEELPDLDLYMDQVITYLERELKLLSIDKDIVTTWMINNYVKGRLLPPPIQKKYSKEHLAYIIIICSLKQILSISDIKDLLRFQINERQKPHDFYDFFRTKLLDIIKEVSEETIKETSQLDLESEDLKILYNHVTILALEAEIKKIIAHKILYILTNIEERKKMLEEIKEIEKINLERLEKEKQIDKYKKKK